MKNENDENTKKNNSKVDVGRVRGKSNKKHARNEIKKIKKKACFFSCMSRASSFTLSTILDINFYYVTFNILNSLLFFILVFFVLHFLLLWWWVKFCFAVYLFLRFPFLIRFFFYYFIPHSVKRNWWTQREERRKKKFTHFTSPFIHKMWKKNSDKKYVHFSLDSFYAFNFQRNSSHMIF